MKKILILLLILGIPFAGYIVYDKYFKDRGISITQANGKENYNLALKKFEQVQELDPTFKSEDIKAFIEFIKNHH